MIRIGRISDVNADFDENWLVVRSLGKAGLAHACPRATAKPVKGTVLQVSGILQDVSGSGSHARISGCCHYDTDMMFWNLFGLPGSRPDGSSKSKNNSSQR